LRALYIAEGAVKASYPTDVLHIAITAVYGLDFIVSHAIRLKIQEEHDVFSSEYAEYCHKTTEAFFAELDIKPHYADLAYT
jgi:hypothetical protein